MSSITLNLELPLSPLDKALLQRLASDASVPGLEVNEPNIIPTEKAEPAPKKAPAKKAPAKKAEPAPEPEPVKEKEEEPVKEEPTESPLQPAISKAAELLSEGRTADVKEALAKFDVERVSKLKVSDVEAFVKALES